ncbi:MAG: NAD(P)H-hydrate dehydratase [Gammaproteobacteria bacterium]|nr:NAD(P)H-hydrate dehydratase [Gammaproteobacteria bacterium]
MFYSHRLYSAQQSRELDRLATAGDADQAGIASYELMQRAANAVFEFSQLKFPQAHSILVLTGAGNNAGDGFLFAKQAMQLGCELNVYSLVDAETLKGDAKKAYLDWLEEGGEFVEDINRAAFNADLIIDAILGTGLQRELSQQWIAIIEQINELETPVIAVDVPSGLNADTGAVQGAAIIADYTVCFIGLKKGLFTGMARNHCGEIIFNDLHVPASVYSQVNEDAYLLSDEELSSHIIQRPACTHKGQTGHLLIVGGNLGMCGAVILAAQAALRSGAGRVSVITRTQHVAAVVAVQPEIMVYGIELPVIPETLLKRVNVIAIGPGLGRDDWGKQLFEQVIHQPHHKILDADAFYHLPDHAADLGDAVITPHPGEAARLLGVDIETIERDRFQAVRQLYQEYNALVVLKGAGTLVYDGSEQVDICPFGNPGMATAGMGDVLTGLIAALMAQGYAKDEAARIGVCIHAQAADAAAKDGQIGLLASDLFSFIRQQINYSTAVTKD